MQKRNFLLICFYSLILNYSYAQFSIVELKDSIEFYLGESTEKVVFFAQKKIKKHKEEKDIEACLYTHLDIIYAFYLDNDFERCNRYISILLNSSELNSFKKKEPIYSFIYNYKGMIDYAKENYLSAGKYFQKGLHIDKKSSDISSNNLAASYNNLASVYDELGDYKQAIYFYKKTLLLDDVDIEIQDAVSLYNNISLCYYKQQNYIEADTYIQKALNLVSTYESDEIFPLKVKTYINLAINYQSLQEYSKALVYLNKVLTFTSLDNRNKARVYKHLGTTHYELKAYDLALENIGKALALRKEIYPKKHSVLSISHQAIAEVHTAQESYNKALNSYQAAIKAVVYDFDSDNTADNPNLNNIVHQVELLKSLSGKANIQFLLEDYQSALATYTLCSDLMDKMRTSFHNNESKLFLLEQSIPIYEQAIEAAIQIGDKATAFQLVEKSKAILLLEATRGIEARFGLSEELLAEEQELKIDIEFYEKKIWKERQNDEPNTASILKWENIIFDLKEAYLQFKKELANNYPEYYQLQYDTKVASVQTIQKKLLNKKQALVSYFVGNKKIYSFTISKRNIEIQTFSKTEQFDKLIQQYRQSLELDKSLVTPHLTYYETASSLYDFLLKKSLENIPKKIQQLIILPSDQLNYIPFEALLTHQPTFKTPRYELSQIPYLIKKYQITYGYSATLLLEKQPTVHKNLKTFGGFVPEFGQAISEKRGCDNTTLGNLPYGKKNIIAINEVMKGVLHFDTAATLQNFKHSAQDYKILHLCTHACASGSFDDSRIYFTDKELLAFELYNLPLKARLAVLSACETGVGELKRGEGVMSLARAFMYSGCPSVITSLWSVDDASTSELMLFFYKNLKEGKAQDEALHLAKLQYLENKGIQASHPYYWSAFIHVGDTEALFQTEQFNYTYWGIAVIAALIIGLLVAFYKRSQ